MKSAQNRAVQKHRRRLKRSGIARIEVRVSNEDVPLVRGVVEALSDPARASTTRALLRDRIGLPAAGLKDWLASAPLDGIELTRDRDVGRHIDLDDD